MTALTENPTYIEEFEEKAQRYYQQIPRSQELGEPPARIIQWRKGSCTTPRTQSTLLTGRVRFCIVQDWCEEVRWRF